MSASKPVFRISISRPSFAATALAASTSKPMAWFGSVTSADGKYSIGGYSMSTQSVSVPAVIRLVGGVIGVSVAGGAVAGAVDGGAVVAAVVAAVVRRGGRACRRSNSRPGRSRSRRVRRIGEVASGGLLGVGLLGLGHDDQPARGGSVSVAYARRTAEAFHCRMGFPVPAARAAAAWRSSPARYRPATKRPSARGDNAPR